MRGRVIEVEDGGGLDGYSVELWRPGGEQSTLIAQDVSGDEGEFGFEVFGDDPGPVEVEFQVLDSERQLIHREQQVLPIGETEHHVELSVTSAATEAERTREPGTVEIRGKVRGSFPEGASVRATLGVLDAGGVRSHVAAQAPVSRSGRFVLLYERSAAAADAALTVQLVGPDAVTLAVSQPVLSAPAQLRIDLHPRRSRGPSEYTLLQQHVGLELGGGLEAVQALRAEALVEVAAWLRIEPERLTLLVAALRLEAETRVPAPAYYGLGRSGLPLALEELYDVSEEELSTTLAEAVASGWIEPLEDLDGVVGRLSQQLVEHALQPRAGAATPGLGAALGAAPLPVEERRDALAWYRARAGELGESSDGGGNPESRPAPLRGELLERLELGAVLGGDARLLERLERWRGEGRWQAPADLVHLDLDDWVELLSELDAEEAPGEAEVSPEARAERLDLSAEAILTALEDAYPSACIHRDLVELDAEDTPLRRLLVRTPDHDFVSESIRDKVAGAPELIDGLDSEDVATAIEEIEKIERVSRVAGSPSEVLTLVRSGMDSALRIGAMPQRRFIDEFAEALGGRARAATVHARAQQTAAANQLAMVSLIQARQQLPRVMSPPDDRLEQVPDAQALFGEAGFCDCAHCGSVYSPAAYFVDLLRYLDVRDPRRVEQIRQNQRRRRRARPALEAAAAAALDQRTRHKPLDVLLARRPDLIDIPLTCENTQTALPYIDLVNEVLEAKVSGRGGAADTGKVPADVLRAVPQALDREAYRRLEAAVHPVSLPFHEPLAVARAYLAHLGVSRRALLEAYAPPEARGDALTAEALGMSLAEFALITGSGGDVFRQLGFSEPNPGGVSFVTTLAQAPRLLAALGIPFAELIELVSTRFVNADTRLTLDAPGLDCDPSKVTLSGLDEPRLARLLGLLRTSRRLGWSATDLDRVLAALGARALDAGVLQKLAATRDLAQRLDLPVASLAALWAPLDTWGPDSPFERLLLTRAVAWFNGDAPFVLRDDRQELAAPRAELEPVAPALLAAFRITNDELSAVRALLSRRGAPPRLDLAGLSAIHRTVLLARCSQLRIEELDILLRLGGSDADPFRPGDPLATRRFVDLVAEVQASEFSPAKLAYLFLHETTPRYDPSPTRAQVSAVIANLRRALVDAYVETAHPSEVVGDTLRQKLALWLDPALLDPALEALDPRSPLSLARRRQFFDRHLASIFPRPDRAASRLFDAPALPASTTGGSATATPSAPAELTEGQAPTRVAAPDQRWTENLRFVLEHLLPRLRTRQLRGAIVQTLSDALGASTRSTARLLEQLLRSRRDPDAPIGADFAGLLGSGLTASYFANPALAGEPTLVRTDAEIALAWSGVAPAASVPAREFSVRWAGQLLPRTGGEHTFHVRTEGAVRLVLTLDGAPRVLLDVRRGSALPVEHTSTPVSLDPGTFYEIVLEYVNQGGAATMSLQLGTSASAKLPIAATQLYPVGGASSFAPAEDSYRRLHKAALLITGLGISDAQLEWLTGEPRYLDLDALPTAPGGAADPAQFGRWRQLASVYGWQKKLPRSAADALDALRPATPEEARARLARGTGWSPGALGELLGASGLALAVGRSLGLPVDPTVRPLVLDLARAMDVQARAGVAPERLLAWARTEPDAAIAAEIVQAVKARYDEARWLEVARSLNDPLRAARRDALVAYLLPRMTDKGVRTQNQLFEYFLIDVQMSPCMLTSRIRQAIAAVQTFFQRCLMSLEQVHPRLLDADDWKWLSSYRVWEANRKVFLYPENWIEPELRDDKSPLFQALERTILQEEIKKENVEAAFLDYLEGLDEVARLDVRAVCFERRERAAAARGAGAKARAASEWEVGTYHVFARTFSAPHVWYYRRLDRGRTWTPWEKLDADVEGDHLVAVVFQRRLHLFWTTFREHSRPPAKLSRKDDSPQELAKDWEIQLAYSVHDRGRWSRKRMSDGALLDKKDIHDEKGSALGSAALSPAVYTLRAAVQRGKLVVYLYRRELDQLTTLRPTSRRGAQAHRHTKLRDVDLEVVARFELDGCNGALSLAGVPRTRAPALLESSDEAVGRRRKVGRRAPGISAPAHAPHPFSVAVGGRLNAPSGYRVDGVALSPARDAAGGALLALRAHARAGVTPVLGRRRAPSEGSRLVPVFDPQLPASVEVFPFFFQDRERCYFARPVDSGGRGVRLHPMLPVLRRFAPLTPARRGTRSQARRGARARTREDVDATSELAVLEPTAFGPTELDAWEDEQDEAWHPEDAEALAPRPLRPRAKRAAAPRVRRPLVAAPVRRRPEPPAVSIGQRLRFVAFEHPQTCRMIRLVKSQGLDKLLQLTTTAPRDRGQWFRRYQPGSLVDPRLPHLDVDFDPDGAYSLYNWELFFHAPLQVATRLAKEGRHEEAQRWFHFIFDPTTDVSTPAPQRYWRFAPFHDASPRLSGARDLVDLISYQGTDTELGRRRDAVIEQITAWLEKPFSPHVIARLRITAYQRAVVMKYIDNLIEWGDKLFRRDTMESIHEATQLYILAGNILGRRQERIAPLAVPKPVTFREVRGRLDHFSNWVVRFENSQVRRPFRVNARPDFAATASVLGMSTQYFCVPHNPQLDKYWDTVSDRLHKIRHCMNIQCVVRQLALFEPPIDPGLLVRAGAAGVDLGSVLSSLNAPPPGHRFRFLLARAVRLAEELRSFGSMTLAALERRDAEALLTLRAQNEVALVDALREIRKKQVKQVEEELAELALEREHIELRIQHVTTQTQELMNPQEKARQESLSAGKVIAGLAEGVDLVSKVMYAIPDFQTGAAGAFSSPFVTLQLGGQMLGDISNAFAESLQKVLSKNETEADMAEAQGEYQRRKAEWQHELELLGKEKAQMDKQLSQAKVKLDIASAELARHDREVENARKVQAFLRDKYTSEQLYGWMLGQVSAVHFQAYKFAFDAAQLAQRALQFERGDPSLSFIEFSYWDSLKRGLFAGERLLLDLRRLEAAQLEGDRRAHEVTRHVSLRADYPLALEELLATGRCQLELSEGLFDADFAGHFFRRIKTVSVSMAGAFAAHDNVNCTLTLLSSRIRTDPNASGTYAASEDGNDARFALNAAPVQAIATSRPQADGGLFELRFEDERYLPFEGAGAISSWRIELRQADNGVNLAALNDVVLSLSYGARHGGSALEAAARAHRERGLARGGLQPAPQLRLSVRRDAPDLWKQLEQAAAGADVEGVLALDAERCSARFRGLDVRVERVVAFARHRIGANVGALRVRLEAPRGSSTALGPFDPPWPGAAVGRASADVSGPLGSWKVGVSTAGAKTNDVLEDLVMVFELRARKV